MGTLNWNFAGRVRVGLPDSSLASLLQITSDTNGECEVQQIQYTGDTSAPTHDFRKARGSQAAPADAAIGDRVIDIRGLARSTTFQFGAAFRAYVDGPGPLVAGQNPPSRLGLQTNLQNVASREVVFISSEGFVGISDALFTTAERPSAHLHILGQGGDVHMHVEKVFADANPPLFEGFKARGTVAARGNVADGDATLRLAGFAYSNTYKDGAQIQFAVDGAVTAGQAPPSRQEFYTNASNVAPTLQASIRSNGMCYIGSSIAGSALLAAPFPTDGHVFGVDGSARHIYLIRASTTNSYNIGFMRSRGNFGALANVTDGDRVARIEASAYSGATGYWSAARLDMEVDGAVVDNQRPGTNMRFYTNAPNTAVAERMYLSPLGNIGLFNMASFGASSVGVLALANATTVPTGNPTGGGVMYAQAGAGKWRGSGGTVTTFGPAEPHCPVCGTDYAKEWDNVAYGYFFICLRCLSDELGARPWILKQPSKLPPADVEVIPPAKPEVPELAEVAGETVTFLGEVK